MPRRLNPAEFRFDRMRRVLSWFLISLAFVNIGGCVTPFMGASPTAAGFKPADVVDLTAYGPNGAAPDIFRQIMILKKRLRESQKPKILPVKRTALLLSGGGSFGAYSAGVLCGWTETGTRPEFDVVTGVSTGALISVFAFLGSEYDCELRRFYTTSHSKDIYRKKLLPIALFSDSLNDSKPLLRQIETAITPEVVRKIAEGHQCGRRLYIGTTDLEGRRPIVWDLGAIAASDKSDRRELLCKLLLASAAIPGFLPAVEIPVEVDGKQYFEHHVDGGLTQPLFFRPPLIASANPSLPMSETLYGSDLFVIVAGKLFADPEPVKPRLLKIISNSLTTFIYAQTQDSLVKLYMQSLLTGMNYHLAAVPDGFVTRKSGTDFDPVEMTRLFEEGQRQTLTRTAWRNTPPGVAGGEGVIQRAGTTLRNVPHEEIVPCMPEDLDEVSEDFLGHVPTSSDKPGHAGLLED